MSFHQLCYLRVRMAGEQSDREVLEEAKQTYPGMDLFDVQYPMALAYSLDVVLYQYDAIVCDEGQDFREEYWLPIEMLLADYETSPLYIFFDDNQNIYSRASSFPIKNEPYLLVTNCRNTDQIHDAAYQYYDGEPVSPPGIDGEEIQLIEAARLDSQAARMHSKIVDLIAMEQVTAGDIAILVADGLHKQEYYDELLRRPLPRPNQWAVEGVRREETVLLDTVKRFKGLEAAIVFLWGLGTLDLDLGTRVALRGAISCEVRNICNLIFRCMPTSLRCSQARYIGCGIKCIALKGRQNASGPDFPPQNWTDLN